MERIEGRRALVTGAASGIGYAIAVSLIKAGARVVLADIDEPELRRVQEPLGNSTAGFVLDVTNREQWTEVKRFSESRFGPIDILVCNAGIGPDGRQLADMDPSSFDRILQINLTGVFNGLSAFAAEMRARREGHIVATASAAGLSPMPGVSAYVATKFAVVGLVDSLRAEMAPHNVGVSLLCPGLVWTRLTQPANVTDEVRRKNAALLQGGIEPAVVAQLVLDGIRANRPYIMTHGEYRPALEVHYRKILAAFDGVPDRGGLRPISGGVQTPQGIAP